MIKSRLGLCPVTLGTVVSKHLAEDHDDRHDQPRDDHSDDDRVRSEVASPGTGHGPLVETREVPPDANGVTCRDVEVHIPAIT